MTICGIRAVCIHILQGAARQLFSPGELQSSQEVEEYEAGLRFNCSLEEDTLEEEEDGQPVTEEVGPSITEEVLEDTKKLPQNQRVVVAGRMPHIRGLRPLEDAGDTDTAIHLVPGQCGKQRDDGMGMGGGEESVTCEDNKLSTVEALQREQTTPYHLGSSQGSKAAGTHMDDHSLICYDAIDSTKRSTATSRAARPNGNHSTPMVSQPSSKQTTLYAGMEQVSEPSIIQPANKGALDVLALFETPPSRIGRKRRSFSTMRVNSAGRLATSANTSGFWSASTTQLSMHSPAAPTSWLDETIQPTNVQHLLQETTADILQSCVQKHASPAGMVTLNTKRHPQSDQRTSGDENGGFHLKNGVIDDSGQTSCKHQCISPLPKLSTMDESQSVSCPVTDSKGRSEVENQSSEKTSPVQAQNSSQENSKQQKSKPNRLSLGKKHKRFAYPNKKQISETCPRKVFKFDAYHGQLSAGVISHKTCHSQEEEVCTSIPIRAKGRAVVHQIVSSHHEVVANSLVTDSKASSSGYDIDMEECLSDRSMMGAIAAEFDEEWHSQKADMVEGGPENTAPVQLEQSIEQCSQSMATWSMSTHNRGLPDAAPASSNSVQQECGQGDGPHVANTLPRGIDIPHSQPTHTASLIADFISANRNSVKVSDAAEKSAQPIIQQVELDASEMVNENESCYEEKEVTSSAFDCAKGRCRQVSESKTTSLSSVYNEVADLDGTGSVPLNHQDPGALTCSQIREVHHILDAFEETEEFSQVAGIHKSPGTPTFQGKQGKEHCHHPQPDLSSVGGVKFNVLPICSVIHGQDKEQDLVKYSDDKLAHKPIIPALPSSCFKTGHGKPIAVSKEALDKAKYLMEEDDATGPEFECTGKMDKLSQHLWDNKLKSQTSCYNKESGSKPLLKKDPNHQVGGCKSADMSSMSMKKSMASLSVEDISSNISGHSLTWSSGLQKQFGKYGKASEVVSWQTAGTGFQTGHGKIVKVSTKAMRKAEDFLENLELNKTYTSFEEHEGEGSFSLPSNDSRTKNGSCYASGTHENTSLDKSHSPNQFLAENFAVKQAANVVGALHEDADAEIIEAFVEEERMVSELSSSKNKDYLPYETAIIGAPSAIESSKNLGDSLDPSAVVENMKLDNRTLQAIRSNKRKLAESAKITAEVAFEESDTTLRTGFPGFVSGGGKKIAVSEASLKVSKAVLTDTQSPPVSTIQHQSESSPAAVANITGFQTGNGHKVKVSRSALQAARKLMIEDDISIKISTSAYCAEKELENEVSQPSLENIGIVPANTAFPGFQTGRGRPISLSASALKAAQLLLDDEEPDHLLCQAKPSAGSSGLQCGGTMKVELARSAVTGRMGMEEGNGKQGRSPSPESHQLGKRLHMSKEALNAPLLSSDGISSGHCSEQDQPVTTSHATMPLANTPVEDEIEKGNSIHLFKFKGSFSGFRTGGGKGIKVSNSALEAAKKVMDYSYTPPGPDQISKSTGHGKKVTKSNNDLHNAKESSDAKQRVTDPFVGFQTGHWTKVSSPVVALNAAKKLITEEETKSGSPCVKQGGEADEFLGFQTGHGKKVTISDKALNDAKRLIMYERNETVNSSVQQGVTFASFVGFKAGHMNEVSISDAKGVISEEDTKQASPRIQGTGPAISSGSQTNLDDKVNLYDKSLDNAKRLIVEEENKTEVSPVKQGVFSVPLVGFQTGHGKKVSISDAALSAAKRLMVEEETKPLCLRINHGRQPDEFPGFQTGHDENVTISDKALNDAKRLIMDEDNSDTKEGVAPEPFVGFQTGHGKTMSISDAALNAAKRLINEEVNMHSSPRGQKGIEFGGSMGFQTGLGKKVTISDKALYDAKTLIMKEDNKTEFSSVKQGVTSVPFFGFQTGHGKRVSISDAALSAAKSLMVDEKTKPMGPVIKQGRQPGEFMGFQTGHGEKVIISDKAVDDAKSFIMEEENDTENSNAKVASVPCVGFQTGHGNKVSLSDTALSVAKNVINDEKKKHGADPDPILPIHVGHGSPVPMSCAAVDPARKILKNEDNVEKESGAQRGMIHKFTPRTNPQTHPAGECKQSVSSHVSVEPAISVAHRVAAGLASTLGSNEAEDVAREASESLAALLSDGLDEMWLSEQDCRQEDRTLKTPTGTGKRGEYRMLHF